MFEVTATYFYSATKTFAPLINRVVDHRPTLQNGPLVKASSFPANTIRGLPTV